jgi:hypothetical protein
MAATPVRVMLPERSRQRAGGRRSTVIARMTKPSVTPRVDGSSRRGVVVVAAMLAAAGPPGCGSEDLAAPGNDTTGAATGGSDPQPSTSAASTGTDGDTDGVPADEATIVHSFGVVDLEPREETQPCVQWTLDNEAAVYAQTVRLTNDGASHHSNWFVVPEDSFPGEDGYYDCDARGFTELGAAVQGMVLFAQSTQSRLDEQRLPAGVVVKIPPRHKVVASGHFLNLSDSPYSTELRMALELIHPKNVAVVTAPFRLTYADLDIPANREAWFTGNCSLASTYEGAAGKPLDLKLYYVTPHYHYLGNYFDLTMAGGPRDGESVFRFDGFNAGSNGQSFDPPIDLTGADGFRFTCGYDNWRNESVGWGVGDQEMCVMLGLADSAVLMDGTVGTGTIVGEQDGIVMNEGSCQVIGLAKNEAQTMPTAAEIAAPLYVPPSSPGDADLPPVPECVDVDPGQAAHEPATLSSISATLFESTCLFSSCHGGDGAQAGGLDLRPDGLHARLMSHVNAGNTDLPLVAPGDPDGSWLYRRIADCAPSDRDGNPVPHMPYNAPTLSRGELVAKVRAWIAAGAADD